LVDDLSSDTVLVLFGPKLESNQTRSAWFKSLDKIGLYLPIYDIEGPHLQRWLKQQLQQRNLQMSPDAQHYLLDYTAGNLLASAQELEKLTLCLGQGSAINLDDVTKYVADQSRYNVFQLMDSLWAGQSERCITILQRLKTEELEPNIIVWALQKDLLLISELQQALVYQGSTKDTLDKHKVWKNKQSLYLKLANNIPATTITQSLSWLSDLDNSLKQFSGYCPYTLLAHIYFLLLNLPVSHLSFPVSQVR
jgi:DNA polymerase-3 subunit delta